MANVETFQFPRNRETVLRMFTDRDYFVRKYERMGSLDIEVVDLIDEDDRFSIRVLHAAPQNAPFPGFIKRILGDRLNLDQRDSWQPGLGEGRIDIVIRGTPVTITINMRLEDNADGCLFTLGYDVEARVPVVGGKVADFVRADVARRMRDDVETSTAMLADY